MVRRRLPQLSLPVAKRPGTHCCSARSNAQCLVRPAKQGHCATLSPVTGTGLLPHASTHRQAHCAAQLVSKLRCDSMRQGVMRCTAHHHHPLPCPHSRPDGTSHKCRPSSLTAPMPLIVVPSLQLRELCSTCRCDISLVAPPFSPPTVPQDPNFGGLRFTMRVEDAWHRWVGWRCHAVCPMEGCSCQAAEYGAVSGKCYLPCAPPPHTQPGDALAAAATLHTASPRPPPTLVPRRGCAEEVYYIIVPRHPAAPRALVSTGTHQGEAAKSAVPAAVALPTRRWTTGEASVVH